MIINTQSEIHILKRLYKPQGNVKQYKSGLYTRSKRPLITNFARCTVHFDPENNFRSIFLELYLTIKIGVEISL